MSIVYFLLSGCLFAKLILSTIDMNAAELQYLADHLTAEECRKLVAAAHLKGFEDPKILDQAERKISKDVPCIELLHHWNSAPGEGKGETHEVLQHRLRQMGKEALADWLGRTVFREIGMDLNRSLERGLKDFVTETTEEAFLAGPTLAPAIENADPTEWTPIDTVLYVIVVCLTVVFLGLICKVCCTALLRWKKQRQKRRVRFKKTRSYSIIEETSGSESEDRFDVRDYADKTNTSSDGES
ncbi:hypothetical protein NQ315_001580 [Exocentrus adspersus]|uniref:Death domain-containing protein n=1 Tax=Exocentrus adspersus TaxID=1586481 RepID=A0AAV8WA25_9CUCU|nr:hypothetical protein NQ315_001580 [Exocentrus adspersus]